MAPWRRRSRPGRGRGLDVELEVDGGIGTATIGAAARAGARVFCAGSALFTPMMADSALALRAAAAQGMG